MLWMLTTPTLGLLLSSSVLCDTLYVLQPYSSRASDPNTHLLSHLWKRVCCECKIGVDPHRLVLEHVFFMYYVVLRDMRSCVKGQEARPQVDPLSQSQKWPRHVIVMICSLETHLPSTKDANYASPPCRAKSAPRRAVTAPRASSPSSQRTRGEGGALRLTCAQPSISE